MKFGKAFILGDSYSTFKGAIPEGNSPYYPRDVIDVRSVSDTWWGMLFNESDAELVLNDSWSGTTVCNTGYEGRDCRDNSFIARLDRRISEGFFKENKIDTLIVFGGTNDNWAGSPVGEVKYGEISEEEKFSVLPAFSYLIEKITSETGVKNVIALINEGFKDEITDGFTEISKHYGAHPLKLKDISKVEGHPNKEGMTAIKDQLIAFEKTL